MKPGDWIESLFGYEDDPEDTAALVIATSKCAFPLSDRKIAEELAERKYVALRPVDWYRSTKAHREGDCCECEPGGFCSDGGGSGWVRVLLAAPAPHTLTELESGCWVWQKAKNHGGYGVTWDGRVTVVAHRHAYELLVGPIPDGLHLDHLCVNPPCVNPAHLEPVTQAENNRRVAERNRA